MISDIRITRGCGNRREIISLVLFKGAGKEMLSSQHPPSKTLRVLVPLVCSVHIPRLCRSGEQRRE